MNTTEALKVARQALEDSNGLLRTIGGEGVEQALAQIHDNENALSALSASAEQQPDYAALEREHLGDPDKRTGIYAPQASQPVAWMKEHKFHPPTFTTDRNAVEHWEKIGEPLIPLYSAPQASDSSQPVSALTDEQKDAIYNAWRAKGDAVSYGDLMDAVERAVLAQTAPVVPELSDDEIVKVLHSLGVDTYPSKYGFPSLQVSATSVEVLRGVIKRCVSAAPSSPIAANSEDAKDAVEYICGANPTPIDADLVGCGKPIHSPEDVYRCTDCAVPFHRECAKRHFETDTPEHAAKVFEEQLRRLDNPIAATQQKKEGE